MRRARVCLTLIFLSPILAARADVAVLMLESTDTGMSRYTSAGHSAVYLSNACQDSPVKLRLCRPGEEGSVITTYGDFGETGSFEWNVVPLYIFLYGVADARDVPVYGDLELRKALQDRYRLDYLRVLCPATPCGTGRGRWRDLVGAAFTRDIYAFRVKTTMKQDRALIDEFNALPNVNRYNGFTRNCADFTRSLVNRYFPGSVRPDRLNDFGMTSPKAVSKSFAGYGKKHAELDYSVERYTQVAGPIQRSEDSRDGTEVIFRPRKWSFPLQVAGAPFVIYSAVAYWFLGRFNPEHEYEAHRRGAEAGLTGEPERETWEAYKGRFSAVLAQAVRDRVFTREQDVDGYFQLVAREGRSGLNAAGGPVLEMDGARVGLTRETMMQPDSDPLVAERLMLARVNATLKAAPKSRESLGEFGKDWEILQEFGQPRPGESIVAAQ